MIKDNEQNVLISKVQLATDYTATNSTLRIINRTPHLFIVLESWLVLFYSHIYLSIHLPVYLFHMIRSKKEILSIIDIFNKPYTIPLVANS